jgi:hypothetical protein
MYRQIFATARQRRRPTVLAVVGASILSREVPLDVVLTEQLVSCRVVFLLDLGWAPALHTRIDKQKEQAYRAQTDARPGDDAAIKPANTKCAMPWITWCRDTGE